MPSGAIAHAPTYEHPDGYKTSGDEVKTLGEWRGSFITRLFETEVPSNMRQVS
jgi:hypothetical protein